LPGYLGYDQPHRLCAGDMARTRVLCELHARQARDEGSYDAVPKDVSAGSNALLLPLRSCDKGSHCHLRGYARNRRASSADVCRFMPPAEDGDQTQMDKLGQNPYLRDKYSTDYNAVTGAGDGAGGAPSDTYGPGSRTFRRTSSGTLIDTLRSHCAGAGPSHPAPPIDDSCSASGVCRSEYPSWSGGKSGIQGHTYPRERRQRHRQHP
jgi:hypothetical protein